MNLELGFRLGTLLVRPRLLSLAVDGREAKLEPRVMQFLVCLARHGETPATRDQLIEEVWDGRVVSEDVINRAASRLRKAVRELGIDQELLETIPRVGYRLTLPAAPWPVPEAEPVVTLAPSSQVAAPVASASRPTHSVPEPKRGRRGLVLIGVLVVVGLLAVAVFRSRDQAPPIARELQLLPLTTLPGREQQPALSVDGRWLAFSWTAPGTQGRQIHIRALDGPAEQRALTDAGDAIDRAPAFSPDGRRIAFVRQRGRQCDVLEVSRDGGAARTVSTCVAAMWPRVAYLDEGRSLLISDGQNGNEPSALQRVALQGSERETLLPPTTQRGDFHPAVSADEARVAFTRLHALGTSELAVYDRTSHRVRTLVTAESDVFSPAWWSASVVLYASDRLGRRELWMSDLDGRAERLALTVGEVGFVAAAPAAGLIAFEAWERDSDIVAATLGDAAPAPEVLATLVSSRTDAQPALSADGRRIALISARDGAESLYVGDLAGSVRRLELGDARLPNAPRFSPDGRRLGFDVRRGADTDLCFADTDTLAVDCRVDAQHEDSLPRFADADTVYFTRSRRGSDYQVWRMHLGTGTEEPVLDGNRFAAVPAEGGRLYFQRSGEPGLFLREADGSERRVDADFPDLNFRNVCAVGADVYWLDARGVGHFDAARGAARHIGMVPGVHTRSGLSIDVANARFLYSRTLRDESDIVLARSPR